MTELERFGPKNAVAVSAMEGMLISKEQMNEMIHDGKMLDDCFRTL